MEGNVILCRTTNATCINLTYSWYFFLWLISKEILLLQEMFPYVITLKIKMIFSRKIVQIYKKVSNWLWNLINSLISGTIIGMLGWQSIPVFECLKMTPSLVMIRSYCFIQTWLCFYIWMKLVFLLGTAVHFFKKELLDCQSCQSQKSIAFHNYEVITDFIIIKFNVTIHLLSLHSLIFYLVDWF